MPFIETNQPDATSLDPLIEKRIVVDYDRVEQVLGTLVCTYETGGYPYDLESTRLPHAHDQLPEGLKLGSLDHAMLLFVACYYMRGGIKSVDAVKRLGLLYETVPDLFDASSARDCNPEDIASLLKAHGLGFQITVSNQWVENAWRLDEHWDGDPRRIFDGVSDYETALAHVKRAKNRKGFVGFKEKMTSMLTYFLMDEGMIKPFDFPLPVDLHVLRMSIAHELVRFEGYNEDENVLSDELLTVLRGLYHEYAQKHDIGPLRLCDAIWLYSVALCGRQPGNITLEPEGRRNRKGRATVLTPLPIDFTSKAQQNTYTATCGSCVVAETCIWNVPSKPYYVHGGLSRRGRRQDFPHPIQSMLQLENQPSYIKAKLKNNFE